MKKTFLLMLFALTAMVGESFAQNSQVATLNHEGNISTYYGSDAFMNAYTMSADGDVIALSGGSFNVSNLVLSRGITIRGAGMKADASLGTLPTTLVGDFTLNNTSGLSIEGIYHDGILKFSTSVSPRFIKCRLNIFRPTVSTSTVSDAHFIHCKIAGSLYLKSSCTATCINSVVNDPRSDESGNNTYYGRFIFTNCYLFTNSPFIKSSVFTNCIIDDMYNTENNVFHSSNVMNYNEGACPTGIDIFAGRSETNVAYPNYDNFLGTFFNHDKNIDDQSFYFSSVLHQGADGSQKGIYGGQLPYSETVTGPRITSASVDSQTSSSGTLSVDISVSAQ